MTMVRPMTTPPSPQSAGRQPQASAAALSDPRDGWEPGVPSLRAMAPSIVGGALVPLAVFYLVRSHVGGDAPALAIGGVPAVLWVASQWIRKRVLDPIGAIVLVGFVVGISAFLALGGNAFVLKIRDPVINALLGVGCLASLWFLPKPLMFYVGRTLAAGNDAVREKLFDQAWQLPSAPRLFKVITVLWGGGLLIDATARILLATALPTGLFLAASPAVDATFIAAMFGTTVMLNRRFRSGIGSIAEIEATTTAPIVSPLESPL
jgi:intracellular septation protein A